jgi:hypothetical protein
MAEHNFYKGRVPFTLGITFVFNIEYLIERGVSECFKRHMEGRFIQKLSYF